MKKHFIFLLFLAGAITARSQDSTAFQTTPVSPSPEKMEVYHLKPAVDIPVTAIGTGWSLYAFTKIYSKDTTPVARVMSLDKNDVAGINRFGVDLFSRKAFNVSNMFFYGSMPFPLVLMLDKDIRKDAGKIGVLWLESMSITGLLYTGSVYFHDKFRPYVYNPDVPIGKRTRGGGKNCFYAGHVGLVATSTFFTAKVFSDYHPHSKFRWVLFAVAGVSTAVTGYTRIKAGEHFLTDVLIGAAQGTLTGILVPHFHKNANHDQRLSLHPNFGAEKGFSLVYRL
jgi:membrane-associated phospholipid phosphatase